ncbi:MAG: SprT family zinc-dependent metalloprotease [bacterium]|nr:SprT family zinc-dependent metalloprotease [bacterium]
MQLSALTKGRVRTLTLTDNRTRIISARAAANGGFAVRIHRCFTEASRETLGCVADFVLGRIRGSERRRILAAIRRHFESHRRPAPSPQAPAVQAPPSKKQQARRIVPQSVGRYVDLRQIRDDLNQRYFDGQLRVEITWGRAPAARRRRRRRGFSIRLGSYSAEQRLVRIHRALDRRDVPLYVIESIVYHEMLHAAVPPLSGQGRRRRLHTPEFRRRERLYPHFERAQRWIEKNLASLAGVD